MLAPKLFFQRLDGADFISELAKHSAQFQEGLISVAFARSKGVAILKNKVLQKNSFHTFFIGINNGVTSKQALEEIFTANIKKEVYLVNTGNAQQIFHPKVYCFYDKHARIGVLSMGSSNLTSGGFEQNVEANILMGIDSSNWTLIETVENNLDFIKSSCIQLKNVSQLDELLKNGFLEDETVVKYVKVVKTNNSLPLSSSTVPKVTLLPAIKSAHLSKATTTSLATATSSSKATTTSPTAAASSSTTAATSTNQYKLVWKSSRLTERDLNVPTGSNTNVTGSMLWKKGLSNLDQLYEFYSKIFSSLSWSPDPKPSKKHLLRAVGRFQIYIYGVYQGEFQLTLTHNTQTNTKSYMQKNSMTSISWGDAKNVIANPSYLGKHMYLYKSNNPADPFILKIDH